jgi:hypothetical protein
MMGEVTEMVTIKTVKFLVMTAKNSGPERKVVRE